MSAFAETCHNVVRLENVVGLHSNDYADFIFFVLAISFPADSMPVTRQNPMRANPTALRI